MIICEKVKLLSRVRLCDPMNCKPTRLLHPWDFPGKNTGVGCHFLLQCMKVKSEREVAQSCPTLCDPMVCSLPRSSIHGIFQARTLEWVAIYFSKGSSQPREGSNPGLWHCRQTLYRLSPPNSKLGYYSYLCDLLLLSNLFPFVSLQTSLKDFPLKVFKCSLNTSHTFVS